MADTLARPQRHEIEVRKSRFLAQAAAVDDTAAAMEWLDQVSDPAATHNCWAWRIGAEYRFNDDGEPAGAGGLVRAYGGATAECLRSAERMLVEEAAGQVGAVHYRSDGLRLLAEVPEQAVDGLDGRLRDASRGRASLQRADLR